MKIMCAHCGAPNLDSDPACYNCGETPVVEPKDTENAEDEKRPTPKRKAPHK